MGGTTCAASWDADMGSPVYDSSNDSPDTDAGSSGDGVGDGTAERLWKSKVKVPVASIYIHAGAGYHSTANELLHLEICGE